jgi:two-component system OmpR family sensor kinase
MKSIRHLLLFWLLLGVSAVFAVGVQLVYFQARHEANALSDSQMKQVVDSLPVHVGRLPTGGIHPDNYMEDDLVIQIWDAGGDRIYLSHQLPQLPEHKESGFFNVETSSGSWRIYNTTRGDTIIQVAQLLKVRQDLATAAARRTILPLAVLYPLLVALICITVVQGLSAVRRTANEVRTRELGLLSSIYDEDLPKEIRPLTRAFNDLLIRLRQAMDAQGAFIADAAHELKTPLTALKLQLQLAEQSVSEEERRAAFADLKKGLARAAHLVQQLLTLARQDPRFYHHVREKIDITALVREMVGEFIPMSEARQIDLGITFAASAHVMGSVESLRTLFNNLLDNAIRYTPQGGRIDVSIRSRPGQVTVAVEDTGPGIPDTDMGRAADRFYRVPGTGPSGSGLGLAIVKQIVKAHKAELVLVNAKPGLHARVTFEAAT